MSLISLRSFFDLPARPTKIDQKWRFLTSVFFVRFGWNLVWGLIMGQKQHRLSLICLRPFFDLPARPTKIDQKWKFLTSVFFVRFGWNLVWGLIMGQKQHRMSLICLRPFFDLPARTTKIDQKWKFLTSVFFVQFGSNLAYGANNGPWITWYKFEVATATFYASTETPHIPSRTIILFRFFWTSSFAICFFLFIQKKGFRHILLIWEEIENNIIRSWTSVWPFLQL